MLKGIYILRYKSADSTGLRKNTRILVSFLIGQSKTTFFASNPEAKISNMLTRVVCGNAPNLLGTTSNSIFQIWGCPRIDSKKSELVRRASHRVKKAMTIVGLRAAQTAKRCVQG